MHTKFSKLLKGILAVGASSFALQAYATPTINEIVVSTPSTDYEFIELTSNTDVSLDNISLVTLRAGGEVYRSIPLSGNIAANGYWLATSPAAEAQYGVTGDQAINDNTFLNSTQTYLLVESSTVAVNDDLDANDDGMLDTGTIAQTQIIDSLALKSNVDDIVYSSDVFAPNGRFIPAGAFLENGSYQIHDFNTVGDDATPQASEGSAGETNTVTLGNCGETATVISMIQGTGETSPLADNVVVVEAVVTNIAEELNGVFLQEETADQDSDPLSSEGLFVYTPNADFSSMSVGQTLRVMGTVTEFFGLTELTDITEQAICDADLVSIEPTVLTLPFASNADKESLESMLVSFDALTVSENWNHAYFGEMTLSNGRLFQPTQIAMPGTAANDVAAMNALNQIILDDKRNGTYRSPILAPNGETTTVANTVRLGDKLGGTATMFYSFGNYKLQAVDVDVTETNVRPMSAPADIQEDALRVMSLNVLNFFTTLDYSGSICGPAMDLGCRGADTATELQRQTDKLVATLSKANAHVVGLNEIENNGFGSTSSIATLVNAVNAATGKTYAYAQPSADYVGDDAISVGIIYDTARVMLAESSSVAILDDAVVNELGGTTPLFTGFATNRASMAASFKDIDTGGVFTVAVNHFKSKGPSDLDDVCSSPAVDANCDQGDGQGYWNDRRTQGAQMLHTWLDTMPTGVDDQDILILGDLNAYRFEDPITTLESLGYTNLIEDFNSETANYSFTFFGQAGTLDYGLANESLYPQVLGASEWHINTDEPRFIDYNEQFGSGSRPDKTADFGTLYAADEFRSSDHDPMIIQLALDNDMPEEPETPDFFEIIKGFLAWLFWLFQ